VLHRGLIEKKLARLVVQDGGAIPMLEEIEQIASSLRTDLDEYIEAKPDMEQSTQGFASLLQRR
jgi:hypothetical protein